MNEAETRAELIDPKLASSGWGGAAKILREHKITLGKIQTGGHGKPMIADYVLTYRGRKLAVIEAKSNELPVGEGIAQAKEYALKLKLDYTYATNGKEIYEVCLKTGKEGLINAFPTPDELWSRVFEKQNDWRDKFDAIAFEQVGGTKQARYYQEIAVNNVLGAVANGKQRILLTLATGTGKTTIAFYIAWKLFYTRWNLNRDGERRPRILFLTDRNFLVNQAFNDFSAFPEDALVRIKPDAIRKKGHVPKNGSIFFTIFQTFMSGPKDTPYFGEYSKDYFDFIIIDECHRGGAKDESRWRGILDYFSPAVQLGMTATPKRDVNIDTYQYFGDPVYIYSLKEGINDGFLTPFKVKRIQTTIDEYVYVSDDTVIEGEVEENRVYTETDFNRIIEIMERESKRVQIMLSQINPKEKTVVFCATQYHAAAVRDLINQYKTNTDPLYCVRVTANDAALGEQYLRDFQDNEKTIPTILTTSQKLSTGMDARNVRNIVLMRPINSMVEFKQIIGRGTRLFDGKEFFTILDFVGAYHHFLDPEWDGEPIDPPIVDPRPIPEPAPTPPEEPGDPNPPQERPKRIKIKLRDGKDREIQHMIATSFWSSDGKPISAEEFLHNLYGALPEFFKNEDELRAIWSKPDTRKAFLDKLADMGFGKDELTMLQRLINAENSDLYDVLEYVSFARKPISRASRAAMAQPAIHQGLDDKQKEFLDFVLAKYVEAGVGELEQEKLPALLTLKYQSLVDALKTLGDPEIIQRTFTEFQKFLYDIDAA